MPRTPLRAKALVAGLFCALSLVPACGGKPASEREAGLERETAALRARVERLEQESASGRASLAADIAAMRQDLRELRTALDEASRNLAAADQEGAARPDRPDTPGKSPRQALRDSLRGMVEGSRQALERLSRELDRRLQKRSDGPKDKQPDGRPENQPGAPPAAQPRAI